MPALYPIMSGTENFRPGDNVRKFVTEHAVTPYSGVVTHIIPATCKVWVQWPIEHSQESPELLIKVNPAIFGLPTVSVDQGYGSYEKDRSEKFFGMGLPKKVTARDKMAIRVAHTFASTIVNDLVQDVGTYHDEGLRDLQAYNRLFHKYSSVCSDHMIRSAVMGIYSELGEKHERT